MDTMQTRSKTCRRSKSGPCKRLTGHNGACRPTLTKAEGRRPVAEVLASLDFVKVVVETPTARVKAGKPPVAMTPKASRPKRPKVVVIPMADYKRIVAAGHKVTRKRGYIVSSRPSARLA